MSSIIASVYIFHLYTKYFTLHSTFCHLLLSAKTTTLAEHICHHYIPHLYNIHESILMSSMNIFTSCEYPFKSVDFSSSSCLQCPNRHGWCHSFVMLIHSIFCLHGLPSSSYLSAHQRNAFLSPKPRH